MPHNPIGVFVLLLVARRCRADIAAEKGEPLNLRPATERSKIHVLTVGNRPCRP